MSESAAAAQAGRFGMQTAEKIIRAQAEAGMNPDRIVQHHEDIAASLLSEATTPEGMAYAQYYAETAEILTRELRENGPAAPAPTGAPHPDPDLAASEWRAAAPGVYARGPQPPADAETADPDREPQPAPAAA